MALIPSRQFYPNTLQSSFSKFHGTPLQFFRYGSSDSMTNHVIFSTHYAVSSDSFIEETPCKKFSCASSSKPINHNSVRGFCSSSWIDKWNGQSKRNQPKPPQLVFNYRSSGGGGGGSGSTMDKIVEKLKKFGYMDDDDDGEKRKKNEERVIEKGSVEDIFYVEEGMLPNTRGGFSKESLLDEKSVFRSNGEVRFPWEKKKEKEEEKWSAKTKSRFSLAELTLPESELRRLRILTFQTKSKTKIGGSGVTQAVVDMIHEKWKTSEIVKLKIEGAPALNMKRMHEILERKTGGLIIWRSGTSVSLYRGVSYEDPSLQLKKQMFYKKETSTSLSSPSASYQTVRDASRVNQLSDAHDSKPKSESSAEDNLNTESLPQVKYEDEVDKLLDGLGPRYTDWPGCDPLPVDADLLPGVVPGYEPPFRVLPYGVRSTLGQNEATSLRRLARVLPPHFALGRSRHLHGLALAMTKLWEKSLIAKIALKRGVPLTTSERMAEDIKKLTGGMLLSRNKDFLIFYRGKDFLSPEVTEALLERERLAKSLQDEEEQARERASAFVLPNADATEQSVITKQSGAAGTLAETLDANARWGKILDDDHKKKVLREAEMIRHANLVKKLEQKLALAERKLMKAERALSKVEESLKPAERQADPESITEEERFMFRKLGLRMKAFLLLGRRGVFDGTVENMHLHWKYRELVKIIVKAPSFEQVKRIALALESESGGVLVSVDKVSKGYAIIVYRGKDYKRPSMIRPKNLLTKRKALARSIELQRREALLQHMSTIESRVAQLRAEIDQMAEVQDQGDEALYNRLDSAYPTDDENSEDEEVERDVETYKSENDSDAEDDNSDDGLYLEANYDVQDVELLTEEDEEEDEEAKQEEFVNADSVRTH